MTLKNLGFVPGFFSHWLWAWLIAYIIGQPLLFAVLPFSRWCAEKITH
ncbi:MAG: DUF2798 domain-containing protein [Candidatus Vogelbacteria bacterium]|nr:DUF2798 domain-containing protein [Candidatus Vogelbacteria bacterium]